MSERLLMSGNEALARAALDARIDLGAGYPGTPSTEILENFARLGGRAQWSPNEKVAFEVALGAAFGGGRAIVTMKHVGLNVAADPLFTATYTGVSGALVVVAADDPGLASSQNEQDSRRYGVAAGIPVIEPADSQESYDFLFAALEISERWKLPVMLRMSTRVSHSKSVVRTRSAIAPLQAAFVRDIPGRVMIPSYARVAHRKLRAKLAEIQAWNETSPMNVETPGGDALGIITSGVAAVHAREAAPGARLLKLAVTHPLPVEKVRAFAAGVKRCVVVEEGDPALYDSIRVAGIAVEGRPEMYRFGELDVTRVRRILARDTSPEPVPPKGKPPELCPGCPHRVSFDVLKELDCIVAGDIGCYTLGVLPPFQAMDTCVCMGAALGVGLGLRHVLPADEARRVVSVIGDSTFIHSGITGLVEMIYNPPKTGHLLIVLDNGTTAMTGLQEHPGTGRTLVHAPTGQVVIEDLARTLGIKDLTIIDPMKDRDAFKGLVQEYLASGKLCMIIVRRPCLLAAKQIRQYETEHKKAT